MSWRELSFICVFRKFSFSMRSRISARLFMSCWSALMMASSSCNSGPTRSTRRWIGGSIFSVSASNVFSLLLRALQISEVSLDQRRTYSMRSDVVFRRSVTVIETSPSVRTRGNCGNMGTRFDWFSSETPRGPTGPYYYRTVETDVGVQQLLTLLVHLYWPRQCLRRLCKHCHCRL